MITLMLRPYLLSFEHKNLGVKVTVATTNVSIRFSLMLFRIVQTLIVA